MILKQRETHAVRIGHLVCGGGAPVLLQSMTNTKTVDISATLAQIRQLVDAGCDVVRVSVPDQASAAAFALLVKDAPCPLVADIHFDYRLALAAIRAGASKIRINPGNIGEWARVKLVIDAAKEHNTAIRIGVNSGSLPRDLLSKHGKPTAAALVEAGVRYLDDFREAGFDQLVFSFKSSSVLTTIEAYRLAATKISWPLHIGVTEAGTAWRGTIHSAVGIGTLLAEGIGETLRVSLTADPVKEAHVGMEILKALGLRRSGISVTACPTCARTPENLIELAEAFEQRVAGMPGEARVAIMGCAVNGPGEAREADLGIALGPGKALLFVGGEIVDTISYDQALDRLYEEVARFIKRQETVDGGLSDAYSGHHPSIQ